MPAETQAEIAEYNRAHRQEVNFALGYAHPGPGMYEHGYSRTPRRVVRDKLEDLLSPIELIVLLSRISRKAA